MAEIDKGLPNVKRPEDELVEEETLEEVDIADQLGKKPIEVTEEDDGGATIDFDPNQVDIPDGGDHFANLAELLPDDILNPMASQLDGDYREYKASRADWERAYTVGLDLLGFKYENRTEPFQGASGATHPVLAEAVTQFQALAYKELLPADGPVRTQVMGMTNPQKEQQYPKSKRFHELSVNGSNERI